MPNNFDQLERNRTEGLRDPSRDVKRNIDSSVGLFRFVGDMVELYLPKLLDIFLHATGGSSKKKDQPIDTNSDSELDSRYPNSH